MIPMQFIAVGVVAAASFAGAWGIQGNRYEAKLSALTTEYAKRDLKELEKAHAETIRLQATKDEAERLAAVRQSAIARDAASARDALGRLSDAADSALRSAGTSHDSCLADANALTVVLGRCAGQLSDVASDADRLTSDIKTLTGAWPRN